MRFKYSETQLKEVSLQVVKNTLLKKAENNSNFEDLYDVLKGNTSIMFTDVALT